MSRSIMALRMGIAIIGSLLSACIANPDLNALAEGEAVPFEVCGHAPRWTRPSEAEQMAIWEEARYAGADQDVLKYPWTHDFFLVYGNASVDYDIVNLSGLWTLPADTRSKCIEAKRQDAILKLQDAEIWVLLHEVKEIRREGTSYTVIVEPRERGVQFVQFPRAAQQEPIHLCFVTPDGDMISELRETEYLYWPYP